MKHFESILLYANASPNCGVALRRAEALAATTKAVLHVVDVVPGPEEMPWTARVFRRFSQAAVDARLRRLGSMVAPVWRRGVSVRVEVLTGTPVDEITRAVLRDGHDLVVVASDAEEDTVRHLLRDCPCPVWVIKGGPSRSSRRRVLAAVDADEDWSDHRSESSRVVELAASVAESGGGMAWDFARKGHLGWLLAFAFALGFGTTVAEPALIAVSGEAAAAAPLSGVIESSEEAAAGYATALRATVALSVGFAVGFGVLRIIKGWPLHWLIIGGYGLVAGLTELAPPEIIGIAYDSGGVTTSTITVPLVTALGVGLSSSIRGRRPMVEEGPP